MTVEIAPKSTHNAPKPHGGAHAQADKAKPGANAGASSADKACGAASTNSGADAGGAGNTGFMAILSSLSDATDTGDGMVGNGGNGGSASDDSGIGSDSSVVVDTGDNLLVNLSATLAIDTKPLAPAEAVPDALSGTATGGPVDPSTVVPTALTHMAAAAMVKQGGLADGVQRPTDGLQGVSQSLQGSAAHGNTKGGKATLAMDLATKADAAAQSPVGTGAGAAQGAAQTPMDFKMFVAMQEQRTTSEAKVPELSVLSGLVKTEKSGNEHNDVMRTPADANYAVPQAAPAGGSTYSISGTADVAVQPEVQVAEQVSYWISQDVQNAELKLDGLGDKPVEVSISMNGNQAHIAFRTDELQTRDVLEGAGAHLKDMLAREGVVLSGVSVGTSGSGNTPEGGDRRPRQGVKQGSVSMTGNIPGIEAGQSSRLGAGRSLDLFV